MSKDTPETAVRFTDEEPVPISSFGPPIATPKKRGGDGTKRRRKASNYLVLVECEPLRVGLTTSGEGPGAGSFVQQAEGATAKECLKAIHEKKLTGKLLVVCVRRRITATVEQVVKLS
jgi:hypothetical protein